MFKRITTLLLILALFLYIWPMSAVKTEASDWQRESIYSIMVDRFSNGNQDNDGDSNVKDPTAYHGGDFQGITNKLDYIRDMGFTTIALSPIFENMDKGYHGYWIKDFYKVNKHFGTMKEFKTLVNEAHKRDMKVIIDFVANNVGANHSWLNDPAKKDWFHTQTSSLSSTGNPEINWINDLPDLNQDNPEVKHYLIDAAKWWIEETHIDGYRLDAITTVPIKFWEEFSEQVKSIKKDVFLLGDAADSSSLAAYQEMGMDGVLNYPQSQAIRTVFSKPDQALTDLFTLSTQNTNQFKKPELLGTFVDNHNETRFTHDMVLHKQFPGTRWQLALSYMFTMPGIPVIYYGSEIAIDGKETPDNRRLMDFRADKDLIEYITKISKIRQEHLALTDGSVKLLQEKDGMAIYERAYVGESKETMIIAINNASKTKSISLDQSLIPEGKELRGVLNDDLVRSEDGNYSVILDRETAEIYLVADESGLNIAYIAVMGLVYILFFVFIYLIWKRGRNKGKR